MHDTVVKKPRILRTFNDILTIAVVCLGLYLMLSPWLPNLNLWLKKRSNTNQGNPYATTAPATPQQKTPQEKPIPKDNRIVIPSILVDETILEGGGAATVDKGVWHRPATSTPFEGSNTVLVGHRFTYYGSEKDVFYHLDKVKIGDDIYLYWEEKPLHYRVTSTFVVPATAIEIEEPSSEEKLTLYTCTPLWTATDRLVVIATPIETPEEKKLP